MIEITLTIVLAVFIGISALFCSQTVYQKDRIEKLEKYRKEFYSVLIKNEKLGEALQLCEAAHDETNAKDNILIRIYLEKINDLTSDIIIADSKIENFIVHIFELKGLNDDLLLQLLAAPTAQAFDDLRAHLNAAREEIYHLKGEKSDVFNDLNNKA